MFQCVGNDIPDIQGASPLIVSVGDGKVYKQALMRRELERICEV